MKTETLDTLLLDRALGELTPEVAALLEDHLAQNPAAASRARELAATFQLARSAVALPHEAPRPLDVERLRRAHQTERAGTRRREILRLAACLALGLTAGWLARTTPTKTEIAVSPVVTTPTPREAATPSAHFWSRAHIAAQHNAAPPERSNHREHLRWDAPLKMPRWEEKL
jgi:anti-sigma factor RsiW